MTISTTSSSVTGLGDGSNSSWDFDFVAASADDISVYYTDASGTITTINSTQYTLSINAPAVGQIWGIGGTVTYPISGSPIASGTSLTIARNVPFQQLVSISNQGDFAPQVIEEMGDTLEMQIQQQEAAIARSIQFPVVDQDLSATLPAAAARANKYVSFDSSGNVIVSTGTGGTSSDALVNQGFNNFIITPVFSDVPALPGSGFSITLPLGSAVMDNTQIVIPEYTFTGTANTITRIWLNAPGAATPFTIDTVASSLYTTLPRYPNLLPLWWIECNASTVSAIYQMGNDFETPILTTDYANTTAQFPEFYGIGALLSVGSVAAFSPSLAVLYREIITTTDGNLYQVFTFAGGTLGATKPTGTGSGPITNGTVTLYYYGQQTYLNNFRYARNNGIQNYFSNIGAKSLCNMVDANGNQMSSLIKSYAINQFQNVLTPRANAATYSFGQKIIAASFSWLNITYGVGAGGGATATATPFSTGYSIGQTVGDGTITWQAVYPIYANQQWFWFDVDSTMLGYSAPDSQDSYAATFFDLLWTYIQVTNDWYWLLGASPIPSKTYLQCLQAIFDNNLSTLSNNLTTTFQSSINPLDGSSYTVQFIEDNTESYSGELAANKIFTMLGDSTRASTASSNASAINTVIANLNATPYFVWPAYLGESIASWYNNDNLPYYPHIQCQFFPELHQLSLVSDDQKEQIRSFVFTKWNSFYSDKGKDTTPACFIGYIAAVYWQDTQKAYDFISIVERYFLLNNSINIQDFGYYLQIKNWLVNNCRVSNINGAQITFQNSFLQPYTLNASRVFTAQSAVVNVYSTDYWVGIKKGTASPTSVLLNFTPSDSFPIVIKDMSGNSATYPITIVPLSGNIDGGTNKVISTNYNFVRLRYSGTASQWYTE